MDNINLKRYLCYSFVPFLYILYPMYIITLCASFYLHKNVLHSKTRYYPKVFLFKIKQIISGTIFDCVY